MIKTKADVLTQEEFATYALDNRTRNYLEEFVERADLETGEVRVLDWGCGRGRAVLSLRERGYSAFGVDNDPRPLQNASPLFKQKGYADTCLSLIDSEGRTDYPDSFFHFTYSNQVFEHVEDLELVATELYRLMAPGAEGLHIYPAQRRIVEGHLLMPFVHWLPKNGLRKGLIWICVALGREPRWRELDGKTVARKTEAYYQYSRNRTYYRPYRQVRSVYEYCGFLVESITSDHPKLNKNRILSLLARSRPSRPIVEYLVSTFKTVELHIRKP